MCSRMIHRKPDVIPRWGRVVQKETSRSEREVRAVLHRLVEGAVDELTRFCFGLGGRRRIRGPVERVFGNLLFGCLPLQLGLVLCSRSSRLFLGFDLRDA